MKESSSRLVYLLRLFKELYVDSARIELAPPQCECGVIPLYYEPGRIIFVGPPRFELGLNPPEGLVLPLHYGPGITLAYR